MNKRGAMLQMIQYINTFKILFLVVIGIFLVFALLQPPQIDEEIVASIEDSVYLGQIVNNPVCLAYKEGERVEGRVIDPAKMTEQRLDACLKFGIPPNIIPAQVVLEQDDGKKKTPINTQTWYGSVSYMRSTLTRVLVKEQQGYEQGKILFDYIPPENS